MTVSGGGSRRHYLVTYCGAEATIRFQAKQAQPIILSLVPLGQLFEPQRSRDIRLSEQTNFNLNHFSEGDRKSTRLNSSHLGISYAVFCLKKKKYKISVGHLVLLFFRHDITSSRSTPKRVHDH